MNLKKIFLFLFFLLNLFILLAVLCFGVYNEIDSICKFLRYQEVSKSIDFKQGKEGNFFKFKQEFKEKTGGIIGSFNFKDDELNYLVFSKEYGSKNFCGDVFFSNCIFLKARNNAFSENFFNRFDLLEEKDEIFFSCFGERKKYCVEKIRDIRDLNEDIYCRNNPNSLNILVEMPFNGIYRNVLIKAVEISNEEENLDFADLFLRNNYLVVFFLCLVFMIFIFLVYFLMMLFRFLREKNFIYKKKYIKKIYDFKL